MRGRAPVKVPLFSSTPAHSLSLCYLGSRKHFSPVTYFFASLISCFVAAEDAVIPTFTSLWGCMFEFLYTSLSNSLTTWIISFMSVWRLAFSCHLSVVAIVLFLYVFTSLCRSQIYATYSRVWPQRVIECLDNFVLLIAPFSLYCVFGYPFVLVLCLNWFILSLLCSLTKYFAWTIFFILLFIS